MGDNKLTPEDYVNLYNSWLIDYDEAKQGMYAYVENEKQQTLDLEDCEHMGLHYYCETGKIPPPIGDRDASGRGPSDESQMTRMYVTGRDLDENIVTKAAHGITAEPGFVLALVLGALGAYAILAKR